MKKYKRGRQIRSMAELEQNETGMFYVNFGKTDKVLHPGFLLSWQYRTLKIAINQGRVFVAERTDDDTH